MERDHSGARGGKYPPKARQTGEARMPSEKVTQRLEKLAQREEIIFSHRDEVEKTINEIIGKKLNPTQLLMLRTQFEEWERCEKTIENIQDEVAELKQAI
jgi:hypothetical protein